MRLWRNSSDAAQGLVLLVLVVEADRDRMVRVVRLRDEVGDGELDLMRPEPAGRILRRKAMPRPEIEQDRGRLADDWSPSFRKGGAKGGCSAFFIIRIMAGTPSGPRATST